MKNSKKIKEQEMNKIENKYAIQKEKRCQVLEKKTHLCKNKIWMVPQELF